ncbi:MAG: TldD/PmbA family protein [Candidatus Dormibacteria bacterium]
MWDLVGHELADRALDAAGAAGAEYADCRVVRREVESLHVKNGRVAQVAVDDDEGFGVRVIVNGAWGFAGSQRADAAGIAEAVDLAVSIARASGRLMGEPVRLAAAPVVQGSYRTPLRIDPFKVPLEDRVGVLMAADLAMARVAGVTVREASMECVREQRHFANSEGSRLDQTIIETGAGLDATATEAGEVQTRSYPNSFGRQQLCAGWEVVEEMDLPGNAERTAAEAVALLSADPCPSGLMTVILDSTQAAMQVHESCGHPTELDRVLGTEAAYAGTSFMTPDLLGTLRYGSDQVTITADATSATGLGSFG